MEFVLDICPICGSKELKILNKKNVDEDIIIDYKCVACGELLSSEVKRNKFVKEKEQLSNIINETSVVKTAKDIFKDNIRCPRTKDTQRKQITSSFALCNITNCTRRELSAFTTIR